MLTRYKVALLLITFFVIFLVKPTSIHAAELDHPPVVTSITGPTTGYYGQTYSFTTAATAADGYTMTTLFLQNDGSTFSSRSAGDSGCTGTDCSFTGNFTPPTTGTFIIHAAANYTNGVDSGTCNSYSGDAYDDCQNSGDKYITFTVLAAPTTPIVQSITGPTSGIVGGTYQFSSYITALSGYPILTGIIYSTTNLLVDDQDRVDVVRTQAADGTACTSSSCAISGTFTPTAVGIYNIHVAVSYTDVGAGYDMYCRTHPASTTYLCSYSSGKYITFVVTTTDNGQGSGDDTDLPSTGLLTKQSGNILIGLGFISLGILTTQMSRILNILGLTVEKKKSRLEKRFE
jgi:hypothetical protein